MSGPAAHGAEPAPVVRIGILATRGPERSMARWGGLPRYLESRIPRYRFEAIPLDAGALAEAVERSEIGFAICSSSSYVSLDSRFEVTPLATVRNSPRPGAVTSVLGSAIIVRNEDRRMRRIGDLRGRRLAAIEKSLMGGWIAAARELREEGIDPDRDLRELRFVGSGEAVVEAVRNGSVDAGVATTGTLERLVVRDQIDQDYFRVLPPRREYGREHAFPLLYSTRLYPESPFLKLPQVPDELARQVTIALLAMESDSPAAIAMESAGWTIPPSYQSVHECMRELRLGPYRDFGQVTLAGAIRQHWDVVMLALLGLATILGAVALWLLRLNRRLRSAGEAWRDSETQFQMVVENQGEGVTVVDGSEQVLFCNPAAEEIFGLPPGGLTGRNLKEFVCPDHLPTLRAETEKRRAAEKSTYEIEIQRPDGERRDVLVTATPRMDSEGQFRGTFGLFRDITDRKRLEERLRQAHKLESVGRLAGGVAHDFNNLLTVINGYTDMALGQIGEHSPLRTPIESIRKAGERAAGLTQQLLAFSLKQVIRPKPRDLNAVVGDAVEVLGRLAGKDIELVTRLHHAPLPVLVDAGQMHQVLMNLAANARDAMPGGGRLTIRTAHEERDAGHPDAEPGAYVLLSVSDTGCGMDEKTRRNIFEPFFTTKEPGKGTGLGLATVYGVVRQNRGWIAVHSEPGKGSTFRIYLPRLNDQPGAAEAAEPVRETRSGSETLLVVEDQEQVLALAAMILKSRGYQVLEAASGAEALLVEGRYPEPIDLLVTDVVMPGMNGPELALRLKALRPELKVLYTSGYTRESMHRRGVLDGDIAYLGKPYSPNSLAAMVREVLDANTPIGSA